MKLVFMTKQNSKAPKLTKTSTPMFLYKPYISKHKLEDMRTLEYYIKLGLVDESVHNLYELLSNAIREFCKANNITTFTMESPIIFTMINKEVKEFVERVKEKDPYCEACNIFGKITDKTKVVDNMPDVKEPISTIRIDGLGFNLDKILISSDSDKLNDDEFYKAHFIDTNRIVVPDAFQYQINDEYSNCLADIVVQELIKIRDTKPLPKPKEYTPPANIEEILAKEIDQLDEDEKYIIRQHEEYLTKKQNDELGLSEKKVDYTKKWVLFEVDEANYFIENLHNISVTEYKKTDIDNIISAIYDKKIAPVYNSDNLCIFVRVETSAFSGKTMLRKKYSQHNSGYLGTQYMGSVVGPVVYTYGPNVYANSFGTIYNGGDTFVSDQAAYKSLHTMGYKNEAHIIHHNEIELLKEGNIKYYPERDELVITF